MILDFAKAERVLRGPAASQARLRRLRALWDVTADKPAPIWTPPQAA